MECYFEILLPSNKVRRAKEKRDIQIYSGTLCLANYKWNLKNWSGVILATQYFMVSSGGEAAKKKSTTMGRYTLCWNIVMYDGLPVYKQDDGDNYLYINKSGNWCVGSVAGHTTCKIFQFSKNSPSPDKTVG